MSKHSLCDGMNRTVYQEFPFLCWEKRGGLFCVCGTEWACGESPSCSMGRCLIWVLLFLVALLGERSRCQALSASASCASQRSPRARVVVGGKGVGWEGSHDPLSSDLSWEHRLLPFECAQIPECTRLADRCEEVFLVGPKTAEYFARTGHLPVSCDKTQEATECGLSVRGQTGSDWEPSAC